MKIKTISLFVLFLLITGCAIASKTVTLIGNDKEQYIGRVDYDGPYNPGGRCYNPGGRC